MTPNAPPPDRHHVSLLGIVFGEHLGDERVLHPEQPERRMKPAPIRAREGNDSIFNSHVEKLVNKPVSHNPRTPSTGLFLGAEISPDRADLQIFGTHLGTAKNRAFKGLTGFNSPLWTNFRTVA